MDALVDGLAAVRFGIVEKPMGFWQHEIRMMLRRRRLEKENCPPAEPAQPADAEGGVLDGDWE